jgi:hypothetical protein
MLDNLRESASQSPFFQDDQMPGQDEKPPEDRKTSQSFLGMTAPQRFVIALLILSMTCMLSALCLLLTEKIVLPGF